MQEKNEGDKATLTFRDCIQYRCGSPDEGEFYIVQGSDWEEAFPDQIFVSSQQHDSLNHYLFYFRDETFECIAKSYDLQIERD